MKALWNNKVIAESNETICLYDKVFFPPHSVKKEYLVESLTHGNSPKIGVSSYYTLKDEDSEYVDAAYFYYDPEPEIKHIRNYITFKKEIEIIED